MPAAAIVGVASLAAGAMQASSARSAARSQQAGNNAAIAEQEAARLQTQQNIQPYLDSGQSGLNGLAGLLNDPNSIKDSQAYQFRFNQGLQGLDRSAASRGSLYSGGADADRISFGQGLASQEYGDQWNRLAGLAQLGQNAAVGVSSLGQQSANAIGNLHSANGQAQAGGQIGSANAWSNALGGLAGLAGQAYGRKSSYQKTGWN
ncbi:hypothetical protein ACYX7E_09905 [Luteimonas sp. RIT-PG2_3]